MLAAAALPTAGFAETPAGTAIVNVGRLNYTAGGQDGAVVSNEHRLIVAERLDVALTAGSATTAPDGSIVATTVLTNRGNGQEAFAVAAGASAGDGRIVRIAVDGDGDGRYDPAHDQVLTDGRTPVLAPGQAVALFVILTAGTTGDVTIRAAAVTGSGATGMAFPGAGDGGGDAVTGPTTASASVTIPLTAAPAAAPSLIKSAAVTAPDGSARAVRGATIAYTLEARFPAAVDGAALADPIPAGTTYEPTSLTLDGAPLSDAADSDAGRGDAAGIAVTLGAQPAAAIRTIRFRVVIQ